MSNKLHVSPRLTPKLSGSCQNTDRWGRRTRYPRLFMVLFPQTYITKFYHDKMVLSTHLAKNELLNFLCLKACHKSISSYSFPFFFPLQSLSSDILLYSSSDNRNVITLAIANTFLFSYIQLHSNMFSSICKIRKCAMSRFYLSNSLLGE